MQLCAIPPIAWTEIYSVVATILVLGFAGLSLMALNKVRAWVLIKFIGQTKDFSRLSGTLVRNNMMVDNILNELLLRFDCLRARTHQFHNGEVFLLATHSWKTTCTHEAVAPGITREMKQDHYILVSQNSDVIGPIVTGDHTITKGCSLLEPISRQCQGNKCTLDRKIFHFKVGEMDMRRSRYDLEQQGVENLIVVNLQTQDQKNGGVTTFGFLALHFAELSEDRLKWISTKLCGLCLDANRIQLLLSKPS